MNRAKKYFWKFNNLFLFSKQKYTVEVKFYTFPLVYSIRPPNDISASDMVWTNGKHAGAERIVYFFFFYNAWIVYF
jgi:hypothetical protein